MPCGAGFTGIMTRYCNAEGVWEAADRSLCGECACSSSSAEQIFCPADDTWPRTPALTTAQLSCGIGFFGMQTRFCDALGAWEEPSASNCGRNSRAGDT